MKEGKGVYVTKRDLSEQPLYLYRKTICVNPVHYISPSIRSNRYSTLKIESNNVGCQFDSKKEITHYPGNITISRRIDTVLPRHRFFQASKSFKDVGVGSVKALPRRKIKRIYLPETDDRGVGSTDLSAFISRRTKLWKSSYYDQKKTSSKCVGGVLEDNVGSVISEKLSPIVHKKSGTTSPGIPIKGFKNIEIGSNTIERILVTATTQVENDALPEEAAKVTRPNFEGKSKQAKPTTKKTEVSVETIKAEKRVKHINKKLDDPSKVFSSDSLVQHVHDLEIPSDNRQSIDLMENKLEREYRRIFSMKSKEKKSSNEEPSTDFKKESTLKRRFEALRRSLAKKDDQKKSGLVIKGSSQKSFASRRDVSINSDPPSLEARSFSNTKIYSPIQYFEQADAGTSKSPYRNPSQFKKDLNSSDVSRLEYESECQGVKGMFKLWGKKFNLEEDYSKQETPPLSSFNMSKKPPELKKLNIDEDKKGKKYSFFKKKNKEKGGFKSKKGVTTGRCEVKDGLVIKMGASNYECKAEVKDYVESLRKNWLDTFLTSDVDSRKSVRIRWNNKTYTTSSSTVFELMENIYKENGVVLKSRSDIITPESSFYKSYTQQVNFLHQEIEAWMIPKLVVENNKIIEPNNETYDAVKISDQKWLIDKSKAFAHKIEIVLRSENVFKVNELNSTACLRIDIPKGFFADSSSGEEGKTQSSDEDEEIYKIVEYETECDLKKQNEDNFEMEDCDENDIRFIVSVKDSRNMESQILETVIKKPPKLRDAIIQGSDVNIPNRCDVIGVGIITQRQLSNAWKPILKIQDVRDTSEESDPNIEQNTKKCELAESYLQDYYRNWIPLGIECFNWCVSDSNLKCSNENSITSFNNQGDGCKSCPNIYDDFQTSTSNEPCIPCGPYRNPSTTSEHIISKQDTKTKTALSGFFNKFKKDKEKDDNLKRVLPKDSLEVFKRRKIYACSNKSKWGVGFDYPEEGPFSVPSIQNKGAQGTLTDGPHLKRPYCKIPPLPSGKPKSCKKHVSLPDCDTINEALAKQTRKIEGILSFKGKGCNVCKKESHVKRTSVTSIVSGRVGPDCLNDCKNEKHPPCQDLSEGCPSTKALLQKRSPTNLDNSRCCMSPSESLQSVGRQLKRRPGCSVPVSPRARQTPRLKSPGRSPCLSKPCLNKPSHHNPTSATSGEKLSPICPHFPPCIKTQSTQKSPTGSACVIPKSTKKLAVSAPNTPKTKKKKVPEPKKCYTEPCSKLPSPKESDEFPWPIKNQNYDEDDRPNSPNQCDRKCDMLPSPTAKSVSKINSEKDCKPDCANRLKVPAPNTNLQNLPDYKPTSQPRLNTNKGRITGVYLKMNPAKKKTCSDECIAWNAPKELVGDPNIIRLNSNEKISLRVKGTTPSTEEIREGQNIRVTDDDGNTLYERIDYRKDCTKQSRAILGDMYKASINRVSTPININNIACEANKDDFKDKKESSVINLIEIQFKLTVTQGDKTTVNINNEEVKEVDEDEKRSQIYLATHDICNVSNNTHKLKERKSKNDVSIRILIKNYKPKSEEYNKKYSNDFSENIANKFQTVSTAYSDGFSERIPENAFSLHRTTIDLTVPTDKHKVNKEQNKDVVSTQLTDAEPMNVLESSQNPTLSKAENRIDHELEENINLYKNTITEELRKEIDRLVDENIEYDEFNVNRQSLDYLRKPKSKLEKKEMLKKIFEKAHESDAKDSKNKKELQDMLKMVLTSDSSANEEMAMSSNGCTSLVPNLVRDTDSMVNYYKMESPLESYDSKLEVYTTDEYIESLNSESENEGKSCMCSKFAERLNLCNTGGGCCCRPVSAKKDEDTNCDLRSDDDICLLNDIEYVDIETQHSKYTANKINSAKSMEGVEKSNFKIREPVVAQVETSNKFKEDVTKIFYKKSSARKIINQCPMKKFNRKTILGISDEDEIIIFNSASSVEKVANTNKEDNEIKTKDLDEVHKGTDVLQLYAIKKAVLEIYAEKTITDKGERTVAKLPKFVYNKESGIKKFENVVNDVFMMSIQR